MTTATFNEFQDTPITETTNRPETREQEHARQVREWTETLSNLPGAQGKKLRRALSCGWC